MDRERVREFVSRHQFALLLSVVAFCAIVFGTWRVAPHLTVPDEAAAVQKSLQMGYSRNPFPRTFKKGGNLHLYLLAVSIVPVALWWVVSGQLTAIRSAASGLPSEPSWGLPPELLGAFYDAMLAGRVLSALFAAATVFVVYLVTRELRGEQSGLVAGATLTVSAGFILAAHYATEDAVLSFMIVATLFLLVRARESDVHRSRWLLAAAIALGLATSAKATGGLLVIPVAIVIIESYWDSLSELVTFVRETWVYPAVALTAYLVTTPSVLVHPTAWLDEIFRYSSNVAGLNVTYSWGEPAWLVQLGHLAVASGLPLFLLTIAATATVIWLLARDRVDRSLWLLLSFVVPYALVISRGKMAQYPRVIPMLPILAVFVGVGFGRVVRARPLVRRSVLGVVALTLVFSAVYAGAGVVDFNQSRSEATEWSEDAFDSGDEVSVYAQRVYLPEFPETVTVSRHEIHSGNEEADWRPHLERLACNEPEHVVLSSYHYRRFFKDPSTYPAVTEQLRRLLNEEGYRIVERFGPPIQTEVSTGSNVRASLSPETHKLDGNPTIVVLERTAEPDSNCNTSAST